MSIQSLFQSLTRWPTRVSALQDLRQPARQFRPSSGFRPQLEELEDRCLLAAAIVSLPDAYAVEENHTLRVGAPGVMANDTFVAANTQVHYPGYLPYLCGGSDACRVPSPYVADLLSWVHDTVYVGLSVKALGSVTLDVGPAYGTLDLNGNGSFTYTPISDFSGLDSFIYTGHFGEWRGAPTPVTILVTPNGVNPTASPSSGNAALASALVKNSPSTSLPISSTASVANAIIVPVVPRADAFFADADLAAPTLRLAGVKKDHLDPIIGASLADSALTTALI